MSGMSKTQEAVIREAVRFMRDAALYCDDTIAPALRYRAEALECALNPQEPLPCPFCCSTRTGDIEDTELLRKEWVVTCYGCGATGPYAHSRADAIAAWNKAKR